MDIEFATNRLAASARSLGEAVRMFGAPTGRRYLRRIGILRAINNFEALYGHRALRFYPLIERKFAPRPGILRAVNSLGDSLRGFRPSARRGDRFGQYAHYSMSLADGVELIIERIDEEKVRVLGVETSNGD